MEARRSSGIRNKKVPEQTNQKTKSSNGKPNPGTRNLSEQRKEHLSRTARRYGGGALRPGNPAGALRAAWTEPRPTTAFRLRRGKVFYGRFAAIGVQAIENLLDFGGPLIEASARSPLRRTLLAGTAQNFVYAPGVPAGGPQHECAARRCKYGRVKCGLHACASGHAEGKG